MEHSQDPSAIWAGLREADLAPESVRQDVRRRVLRPFVQSGERESAIDVLERLIAARPTAREQSELASQYVRSGQYARAVETIDLLRSTNPTDLDLQAQALQICLAAGEVTRAAEIAMECQDDWDVDGRLADLAARALYRAGHTGAAVAAARCSGELNAGNAEALVKAAAILNAEGLASIARNLLRGLGAEAVEDPAVALELGRALWLLDRNSAEGANLLLAAHHARPMHRRTADLAARAARDAGRPAAALEAIECAGSMEGSVAARLLYARCLREAHRTEEAADQIIKVLEDDPDTLTTRRYAAGLLAAAGRTSLARAVHAETLSRRGADLPETLAGGLRRIFDGSEDRGPVIPSARFDWAWNQLIRLDAAPSDRTAWEAKVRRGAAADQLLLDWLECRPDQRGEVLSLIDGVPEATNVLESALAMGRGAIVASAHVGALFSAPAAMVATGLPVAWLASTPSPEGPEIPGTGGAQLLSSSAADPSVLARSVLRALGQNRLVGIAIDGAAVPGAPRATLFDRRIALSDFAPRLALRQATPTFFADMRWRNGRLQGCVHALPAPDTGEAARDFVARWSAAFLIHIEDLFRSDPDNLRMTGGFWSSIAV